MARRPGGLSKIRDGHGGARWPTEQPACGVAALLQHIAAAFFRQCIQPATHRAATAAPDAAHHEHAATFQPLTAMLCLPGCVPLPLVLCRHAAA
jgi:hypothetical protein